MKRELMKSAFILQRDSTQRLVLTVYDKEGQQASVTLDKRGTEEFEKVAPRFSKEAAGQAQIVYMQIAPGSTDIQLVTMDLVIGKKKP